MSQELEVAEKPATTPRQRFKFTPEQAREAQLKAAKARKENRSLAISDLDRIKQELELTRPIVLAAQAKIASVALTSDDEYRMAELKRVREGLDALWSDFYRTNDTKERKFIADSLKALSAMEFDLAKRPKPAAYRTAPEKAKRPGQQSGPVDAD